MLKKVKNWLGIEGVKISLDVSETFDLKSGMLSGSYTISSQSEQFIKSVRLILKEKYIRGRRKSKLIDEYILAENTIDVEQKIDKDELITQAFELSFKRILAPVDKFGAKNFIYMGLMKMAKVLKNAKSQYSLIVEAEVKGNKLKPYDKAELVAE